MNKFKSRLKAIMAKVAAENSQPLADIKKDSDINSDSAEVQAADEVAFDTAENFTDGENYEMKVLTATPAEIEYWHSYGGYGQLQQLLLKWQLSHFTPYTGYDRFKIGFDFRRNCATFALDATQYVTIPFEDGRPANIRYADKVLNYLKDLAQDLLTGRE